MLRRQYWSQAASLAVSSGQCAAQQRFILCPAAGRRLLLAPQQKVGHADGTAEAAVGGRRRDAPKLAVPSRQGHLRLERRLQAGRGARSDVVESAEELALKHNAFNLVMKMLYGRLSAAEDTLADAHRVLGMPPASANGKGEGASSSPLDAVRCKAGAFSSIDEAGAFAKTFIDHQKELWAQYDLAMARLRYSRPSKGGGGAAAAQQEASDSSKGLKERAGKKKGDSATGGPKGPPVSLAAIAESEDIDSLLAMAMPARQGPSDYFAGAEGSARSVRDAHAARRRRGNGVSPPSDLIARLYARRAAKAEREAQRLSHGDVASQARHGGAAALAGGEDVTVDVLTAASTARDRLYALLAPSPQYAHGLKGCRVGEYVSFTDMLTNHGALYTAGCDRSGDAAEDLFVASQMASSGSRTLGAGRLAAMRAQYGKGQPALRYLFAPPGMLVRGYAAARVGTTRVAALEPEDSWLSRCREDVVNFERFCLAKISAASLHNLTTHITHMLRKGAGGEAAGAGRGSTVDTVHIMNLFLQYRGLPTASVDRRGAERALMAPQSVADSITALFNDAHSRAIGALPIVTAEQSVPIAQLAAVIDAPPPGGCMASRMGLVRGHAPRPGVPCGPPIGDAEEVASLLSAYRQQAMFLRRHANAFSPSLAQHAASQPTGSRMDDKAVAEEAARTARADGVHTFDAVMAARERAGGQKRRQ